ncbi:MAG: nicotinate-nucleotide diphosphorylase (carboxylating) [bacterium (Candidatus Stahlbacteria) CG23_combo_of_CG06-09_8_20_14_all_34_7]|nr:MAG: nicotinate-nucleotide diphosphorylase (carboxylating) [bacterium (Candidatus Stahlbacteria) CG23_combo_of_CG06-09_8_20_14_all_34_7]
MKRGSELNIFKFVSRSLIENNVMEAIKEDKAFFDITTQMCVPEDMEGTAVVMAKEKGIACGIQISEVVLQNFGTYVVEYIHEDGDFIENNDELLRIKGKMRGILSAERTLLNYIQMLSGISTVTNKFVKLTEASGIKILDTRKTTPAMRHLEKYAVLTGGGVNHRFDLFDQIMIKDNHLSILKNELSVINRMKNKYPDKLIVIEVENSSEIENALKYPIDRILLDNMTPKEIRESVEIVKGRSSIEVSGNITDENIKNYLIEGVEFISIGKLTHSFKSLNLSMRVNNV